MSTQGETAAKRPGELFSPRTLLAIIAIGTAAFVGMVYLGMLGIDDPDFEIGPSTYSSSALGHKALVEGDAAAHRRAGGGQPLPGRREDRQRQPAGRGRARRQR